jgi:hypothetical protein
MEVEIGVLNESYSAEEEFMLFQHSGEATDLPIEIREKMTVEQLINCQQGDWIMLLDDVVKVTGTHHPFKIHAKSDAKVLVEEMEESDA